MEGSSGSSLESSGFWRALECYFELNLSAFGDFSLSHCDKETVTEVVAKLFGCIWGNDRLIDSSGIVCLWEQEGRLVWENDIRVALKLPFSLRSIFNKTLKKVVF